jgi:ATP-dependent RNA helicase RhlE
MVLQHKDLLGLAQTGTGKTAAFAIPIIQHIYNSPKAAGKKRPIKALILTPTRELALQIDECIEEYSTYTGVTHCVIFGGVKQNTQVSALKNGVDILTATPGRLLDLMNQGFVNLNDISFFVLDEADRMLDMGFFEDIMQVVKKLPTDPEYPPKKRQADNVNNN